MEHPEDPSQRISLEAMGTSNNLIFLRGQQRRPLIQQYQNFGETGFSRSPYLIANGRAASALPEGYEFGATLPVILDY